jgi:hypothetical protein
MAEVPVALVPTPHRAVSAWSRRFEVEHQRRSAKPQH